MFCLVNATGGNVTGATGGNGEPGLTSDGLGGRKGPRVELPAQPGAGGNTTLGGKVQFGKIDCKGGCTFNFNRMRKKLSRGTSASTNSTINSLTLPAHKNRLKERKV